VADDEPTKWYWCLRHQRAEKAGAACGSDLRMGPYPTEAAAQRYAETAQARDETWEAEDERWKGERD
jgi:hypothetical protein